MTDRIAVRDLAGDTRLGRDTLAGPCGVLASRLESVRRRKLACLGQAAGRDEARDGSDAAQRRQALPSGPGRG